MPGSGLHHHEVDKSSQCLTGNFGDGPDLLFLFALCRLSGLANIEMSTGDHGQKARKLVVPDLEQNSVERKRVLNVLAQRRYRRRKKEHLQRLEKLNDQEFSLTTASDPVGNVNFSDHTSMLGSYTDQGSKSLTESQPATFTAFPNEASAFPQTCEDPFDFGPTSIETLEAPTFTLPYFEPSPSATLATSSSYSTAQTSPESHLTATSGSNFPDEAYLPMGELDLLRGAMSIAQRLGCDSIIWSLEANSLFHNSVASLHTYLPANLRPTRTQLTYPHHPALDILPWPSVRDKLIFMFAQPEHLRPPAARSPTALVEFVYDLEDTFEGARIRGDDPYSDQNWEVGEKLFQNWWWALDRQVLQRSNQLRLARGASVLGASRRIQEID